MDHFDVLVVGAGLAGLECARRLGERGLEVLLVDAKASLAEGVHTTGIFVRRTLEDFPIPEDLLGAPLRRVTLWSPARQAQVIESPRTEFRIGRMGRLYERWLERATRAGVRFRGETRFLTAEEDARGCRITLRSARGTEEVRASFVVGADGAGSRVAAAFGLDVNRDLIVGVEDVYRDDGRAEEPALHVFLDPRLAPGYLAWLARDGEEVHLGLAGAAPGWRPLSALEAFRASVRPLFDAARASLIERRGGRIPVGGVLERIAGRTCLLVGDAAGAVSPLTAGGLDPCLRLSRYAAEVLAAHLGGADSAALASYSGARFRARFVARRWMRRVYTALRSPFLVELACAALRRPPLLLLARHVFFGRGSFPDLALPAAVAHPALGRARSG